MLCVSNFHAKVFHKEYSYFFYQIKNCVSNHYEEKLWLNHYVSQHFQFHYCLLQLTLTNKIWQYRELTECWQANCPTLGKIFTLLIVTFTEWSLGKNLFSLLCLFAQGFVLYKHIAKAERSPLTLFSKESIYQSASKTWWGQR